MSASEEMSYSFTEKLEFDEILFSSNHTFLETLTQTLIHRNVSKSSNNANLILKYYYSHGQLLELLMWTFEKELTENPPETKYFPLQSGHSLFITFYKEYVKLFLGDYLKDVLTPVFNLIMDSSCELDISAFQGSNNETNEEEAKQMTDNYKHSLDSLMKVIGLLNQNILKGTPLLPPHFIILIQKIINRLSQYKNVSNQLFSVLLFQYTIMPIIENPSIINYLPNKNLYLLNIHKLLFLKETLIGMHKHSEEGMFAYIVALINQLADPTEELLTYLMVEIDFEEGPETLSQQSYFHKELVKMVKENIQLIIDSLPPRISDRLLSIISAEHYVLDDYHVFHSVLENINKYCLYYNRQMEYNIKMSLEKRVALQQIQIDCQQHEQQLQQKRDINEQLLKKLNGMLQKKGLPTVTRVLPIIKTPEKVNEKEQTYLVPSLKDEPKKKKRTRKPSFYEMVMGRKNKKDKKDDYR